MVQRRMSSHHSMHHVIIIKAYIIKSKCIVDCALQIIHHSMEEYHHKNKLLYTPHSLCLHMLLTHQYTHSLLIPVYIYLYISLYTHINTILFTPLTDKLYIHSILNLLYIHSHLQTHCTYILMSTLTVNHMLLLYIKYIILFTYIPCLFVHVKLSISLSHSYHICYIIKRCSFLLSTCCSSRSQPT